MGNGKLMDGWGNADVRVSNRDEKALEGDPDDDAGEALPLPDPGVRGDDSVGEAPDCPNACPKVNPERGRNEGEAGSAPERESREGATPSGDPKR